MHKVTFKTVENSFFSALKSKVDRYFNEHQLDPSGNGRLYVKSSIQIATALVMYGALLFFTPVWWVSVLLCVLLGLNLAIIGFNIMHEGGHQSFSRYSWLNRVSAYSLNVLGGNSYFWKIKHNINHHTFTNIEGMDSDIDVRPFMRLHPEQPRHTLHRFQHVYWVILYGISYIVWVFYEDFLKYFTRRVAIHMEPKNLPVREHIIFWSTKIFYVTFYLVLPMVMVGWLKALIGFGIIAFVCGLFISIVFQLAHVVRGTEFPRPDTISGKIQQEWAVHQLSTTSNFGTQSKLLFWLLGGLNFQIEHHLFPRISHIHYPQVSRFVRETCREYNIVYHEYSSMFKAFTSHLLHLRKLGEAY